MPNKPLKCNCGRPATTRIGYFDGGIFGYSPWMCSVCRAVDTFVRYADERPTQTEIETYRKKQECEYDAKTT